MSQRRPDIISYFFITPHVSFFKQSFACDCLQNESSLSFSLFFSTFRPLFFSPFIRRFKAARRDRARLNIDPHHRSLRLDHTYLTMVPPQYRHCRVAKVYGHCSCTMLELVLSALRVLRVICRRLGQSLREYEEEKKLRRMFSRIT